MSQSPFARAFITSACIAGAVFTASTFPLALSESKVVDLELENQTIFSSEVKDLAAPYLSLSGAFSIALGFGVFGMLGWRNSVKKLSKVEHQTSDLARNLAIHQAELERIRFSESRLKAQNLSPFLASSPAANFHPKAPEPISASEFAFGMTTQQPAVPASLESQPSLHQVQAPEVHRPSAPQPVPANGFVNQVPSPTEQRGEVLDQLLQQINQLSQQVEELKGGNPDGLAA